MAPAQIPGRAPAMSLTLHGLPQHDGRATLVAAGGEIDMSNAHLLVAFVALAAGPRPTRVVLDLSQVTFFGTDGIRALESADDMLTRAGTRLTMSNPAGCVRFVLAVTGLSERFAVIEVARPGPAEPVTSHWPDGDPGHPAGPRRNERASHCPGRHRSGLDRPSGQCHRPRSPGTNPRDGDRSL